MSSFSQDIRQFVIENFLFSDEKSAIPDEASLLDAGIIDSTGILELVSHLENTYNIQVADAEIIPDNLDSVAKIALYLERKLAVSAVA